MRKYRNEPCEVGGEKYRSKREMRRHQELLLLEKCGAIAGLKREVPFVLAPAVRIGGRMKPELRYVADFVYRDFAAGPKGDDIVEDAKGVRTEAYRIKRHLMATIHGIHIRET